MSNRKFTKTHNDLNWLFPEIPNVKYCVHGNEAFDYFEEMASQLLETAHDGEDEFTKEDLIDAFMKGVSEAHQHIGYYVFVNNQMLLNKNEMEKRINAITKEYDTRRIR